MNNVLNYANGCKPNTKDKRDFVYEDIVLGAPSIDYNAGFDIRWLLGDDISYLDQMQSYSCVACATAYQVWVYQILEMIRDYSLKEGKQVNLKWLRINKSDEVKKISFKAIYSQISLGYAQGAAIRDAGKLVVNWGSVFDTLVPSMKPDGMTDETWVINKSWKTSQIDENAKTLQGKDYRFITSNTMDIIAMAIKENNGVIGGVTGINNGTWLTERPTPPTASDYATAWKLWGHALWFGAYGKDSIGNYIATPNSWDSSFSWRKKDWTPDKPAGYGWQKLYIDWFTPIQMPDYNAYPMFNPMTFTDKDNEIAGICNVDRRYYKNENKTKEGKVKADLKKTLKRDPTQREVNAITYGDWQLGDLIRTEEWLYATYQSAVNSGVYTR